MHSRPLPAPDPSADVFRQAFKNSPAMQTVTRVSDRVVIEANDSFLKNLGYAREEVIGQTTFVGRFWVKPELSVPFIAELAAKGFVRAFEVEVYTKDREIRTLLLSADTMDIGGEPHVVGAGVDITARKQAEAHLQATLEKLRQSEERFSKAFRANPALVAITRLSDGRYISVNDAYARTTGYTESELLGRTTLEVGIFTTPQARVDFVAAIREHGSLRDYELPLRRKDGAVRNMLLSTDPLDVDGEPHLLTVGVDITERKESESQLRAAHDKLRQSEERFSKAFQANPAVVVITRMEDGRYVSVNDAYARTLGYTTEELLGKTTVEIGIFTPEARDAFVAAIRAQGFVRDYEVTVQRRDGTTRVILVSADPIEVDGQPHLLAVGLDITERKESEAKLRTVLEQLRQSEDRFSKAFRLNPSIVAMTRISDGKFVMVNDAFLRASHYREDQVLGRTSLELGLHASTRQREVFLAQANAGTLRDFEMIVSRPDGTEDTILASGERIEVDGEPHLLTVGVDITARKRAEARLQESQQRLRESEAQFATAFRASPVLMTIATQKDGRFVEVNEAFIQLTGWKREEILGRTSLDLGLWVEPEKRKNFYDRTKPNGDVREVECLIRDRSGKVHTMQISGENVEINGVPHLLTFGVDITAQQQAAQVLREGEARTRALYESISTTVLVQDDVGFIQLNSQAHKLFRTKNPADVLGRRLRDFSPERQPDGEPSVAGLQRHYDRARATGYHRFEWMGRRADGEEFPMEVTLTALQLEGRMVLQAVIIDLSDFKRTEAELQSALLKERELHQLKSDFVSLVSHEFRTPLEIIMSSADNLDRYHDRLPPERRRQLLTTINRSVRRMTGMMEEVLLLGRLEAGGTEFKPVPLDLAALCRRVADEMETATQRRSPIQCLTNGDLTGARGDEAALRHVLTNLLSNAVKYSNAGDPVSLEVRRDGVEVAICISDRGCGIPAADQVRLFQAFHRGSNVRQIPGTGLGLLIVRRCVDLHAGRVEFTSAEGHGSSFTVHLPLFAGADLSTDGEEATFANPT